MRQKSQLQQQEIQHLNEQYQSLHRKYLNRGDEVEREREEKEVTAQELADARRTKTRFQLEKDEMDRIMRQEASTREATEQKLLFAHKELQ